MESKIRTTCKERKPEKRKEERGKRDEKMKRKTRENLWLPESISSLEIRVLVRTFHFMVQWRFGRLK